MQEYFTLARTVLVVILVALAAFYAASLDVVIVATP
jgi:hypothetical protein